MIKVCDDKPLLVLVHGFGVDSRVWQPLQYVLSKFFRIQSLDLPGFGLAPMIDPYSLISVTDYLRNAVCEPAIWMGWSLGGLCVQALALAYPSCIRQMIVVAGSPCFVANEYWPGILPSVLQDFLANVVSDPQKILLQFLALQTLSAENPQGVLRYLRGLVLQQPLKDPRVLSSALELLITTDLRMDLKKITLPCDFIFGTHDKIVPIEVAASLAKTIPTINTHTIKNAGHAPFLSHPQAFMQLLEKICYASIKCI